MCNPSTSRLPFHYNSLYTFRFGVNWEELHDFEMVRIGWLYCLCIQLLMDKTLHQLTSWNDNYSFESTKRVLANLAQRLHVFTKRIGFGSLWNVGSFQTINDAKKRWLLVLNMILQVTTCWLQKVAQSLFARWASAPSGGKVKASR